MIMNTHQVSRGPPTIALSRLHTVLLHLLRRVHHILCNWSTFHTLIEFCEELLHGRARQLRLLGYLGVRLRSGGCWRLLLLLLLVPLRREKILLSRRGWVHSEASILQIGTSSDSIVVCSSALLIIVRIRGGLNFVSHNCLDVIDDLARTKHEVGRVVWHDLKFRFGTDIAFLHVVTTHAMACGDRSGSWSRSLLFNLHNAFLV